MKCFTILGLVSHVALTTAAPAAAPDSLFPLTVGQTFQYSKSDWRNTHDGVGVGVDAYKTYTGDGSSGAGWPMISQWVSFEDMFDGQKSLMKEACTNLQLPANSDTTDQEIGMLWDAIQSVASRSGVDHRFILGVVMQESKGCVRIWTTDNGVRNPGLMQDHNGVHTCNSGTQGAPQVTNPCPKAQIHGMISDGVSGTATGDGLAAILNTVIGHALAQGSSADGSSAQAHYQAARLYNSGSVDYSALENPLGATKCYASDIANWLTGWKGGMGAQSTCK